MKTTSPSPALTHERCQCRTPKGRQCASHILDPESNFCPRHSASQPPDTRNFSAVLTENASDFQDPQGINHSLAALYKLLASGQISPRRATGLAYIASLLLRTLPAIDKQLNQPIQYEIYVPPRGRVGCSEDEEPPTRPEPTSPENPTIPADDGPQVIAQTGHRSQQSAAQASLLQQAPATEVPTTSTRLPAVAGPPQAVIPPSPLSPVWAGPSFERSPFRSVPIFRRARSMWKPHFNATAPGAVHRAYACDVQLPPLQLRLARIHHSRRQADRPDLFRRTSAAGPGGHSAHEIRGRIRKQAGIREQARRSLPPRPATVVNSRVQIGGHMRLHFSDAKWALIAAVCLLAVALFVVFVINPGGFEGQMGWAFLLLPGLFPASWLADLVHEFSPGAHLAPSAESLSIWAVIVGFNFAWYWVLSFAAIKVFRAGGWQLGSPEL
jgi:hypothetical protein